jgi:hypothetical protein
MLVPSVLRTVNAVKFKRKMRGGSQAHLLLADDGSHYVVKFTENPQGQRTLINEILSWIILKYLRIAASEAVLVRVSAEFLRDNPGVALSTGKRNRAPRPGLHFGSAYAVDPTVEPVYDVLPDALMQRVLNVREFLGVLVFDKWTANADIRQAVFFRPPIEWGNRTEAGRGTYVVRMIDHGYTFNGGEWTLRNAPRQGLYRSPVVYANVKSLGDFEPWLHLARTLPADRLWSGVAQVPNDWFRAEDRDAVGFLIAELCKSRARLPDSIMGVREANPDLFPNWA